MVGTAQGRLCPPYGLHLPCPLQSIELRRGLLRLRHRIRTERAGAGERRRPVAIIRIVDVDIGSETTTNFFSAAARAKVASLHSLQNPSPFSIGAARAPAAISSDSSSTPMRIIGRPPRWRYYGKH